MRFLVVLGVTAFLVGCSDSRCSVENCRLMMDRCNLLLNAGPSYSRCELAGLVDEESKEFQEHSREACSNACNAADLGEFVECTAKVSTQCAEASTQDERFALVVFSCPTERKVRDAECLRGCNETRRACEIDCSDTSFKACGDCSAKCGLDWQPCSEKCVKE